jgi:hypothetical protein
MEFSSDVWNGISSYLGSDGRALGENNAIPQVYCPVNRTLSKVCTFPGSRFGLPVNVTALRTVMRVWDDVCQFAVLIRAQHLRSLSLPEGSLSLLQGYLLSKSAAGRVAYLVRSAGSRAKPDDLDSVETAFFTLGVGPFMLARSLMEQGELAAFECPSYSGEEFYRLADQHGTLLSAKGWACAGNPRLIVDFMELVMNGPTAPIKVTSVAANRAFERIKDWDRFYGYLYASSRLELILNLATTSKGLAQLLVSGSITGDSLRRIDTLANCLRINVALLNELRCSDPVSWLEVISMDRFGADFELGPTRLDVAMQSFADVVQSAAQQELDQIGQALGRRAYRLDGDTFLRRVWGY